MKYVLPLCLLACLSISCGGDSDDKATENGNNGEPNVTDSNSTDSNGTTTETGAIDERFVGVWDWSDTFEDGTVDEWYLSIDSDGNISDYDYDGDSYDDGENCYLIDRNWAKFERSGDHYLYSQRDSEPLQAQLSIEGGDLIMTVLEDSGEFVEGESVLFAEGGNNLPSVDDMESAECR